VFFSEIKNFSRLFIVVRLISVLCFVFCLGNFASALSIRCEFSQTEEYHVIGKPYRCEVTSLTNSSGDDSVSEVVGSHEPGKTLQDVKLLLIQDQTVLNLPRNIQKFLPNLEGLIVDNSSLREISKADLVNFPKLKLLFIGRNKIDKIESDLFEGCSGIEYLIFINNFTRKIGADILTPLTKLKFANFSQNTCSLKKATNQREIDVLKSEILKKCQ
jgi:Leucine-rich repeat (LRR) protein